MRRLRQAFVPSPRRNDGAAAPSWACAACGRANPAGTRFCGHCGVGRFHAAVVDEQRLVTALFADISGFTTLADRLDASSLHRVIAPVIGVLTSVAERYEGTIAKYAGDAVMVFFGAPVAVEDHAERAVACAIDMHEALVQALPRLAPEAAHLELHVGVNSGRVIAGMAGGDVAADYSILGDAVNVAQRLESVAPPGATYVGKLTHELSAHAFDYEELGGLPVKQTGAGARMACHRGPSAAGTHRRSLHRVRRSRSTLVPRPEPTKIGNGALNDLVMTAHRRVHRVRLTLPPTSRPLDIGQDKDQRLHRPPT